MPLRDPFADLIAPRESDPFGDLIASVEPAAPSRPASTPSQSRYEALLQLDVPRARTSDLPLAGRGSMPADRTVEEQRVIEEAPVYNQPSVPRPSVPDPASRHDPFVSPETVAEYERAKAMHARQGYPLNNDPESSFLNDMRLALVQGGVGIAKGAVGLADMASQAGEAIAGNIAAGRIPTDPTGAILPSPVRVPQLGQQLSDAGIRFDDIQAGLESGKTDALRGQSQAFQEADGIMRKAGIAATSPRLIVDAALQSLPGMVASGAVASRLLGSTPLAAAVGEGGFMAGTDATAMREESPDGRLSKEQMALSAAIGFIGGAIGRASNALAKTLGTTDVDGLLVGIARNPSSRQSFARNIALNYVQEGSEEVAQGIFETALTNLGTGKPLTDGMAADALLGFAVGGAMGAGAEVAQIPAGLVERREARQAQAADDARRAENTAAFNAANEVYNQRFTPEGRATALEQWRQEQQAQAAPPASPENVRAAFDRMRAGRSAATTTEEQANIPVETAPIGQDIGQPIGQEPEVSDSAAPWSNDGINESSLLKTHQANYSPMASFDDLIAPVEASQTASTSAQVSTDSTQQFVKAAKVSVELDGTGALVVRFVKQPSYGTLESLKSRGFRWSKEDKAWYHRNPERLTTERGDDALRFAIQKTRALVGLPIDEDLRKPDFDYNEERKRRASTPSTQAAGASMEPDSFDMAPRERVSDDEARAALTDEDRVADAPAGAGRDWPLILGHARAQGYTGSAEALLRAKQDIEGFEAAGREETDSTDTGVELLKAIRDAGGIKDDGGGEFATLWEASTGFVPQGKTKAGDRYKKSRNYATGGLLGVGNVLRKYGSGGQSWDYIREALSQDPAFRRFADASVADLQNEVMELVATRTAQGEGREARSRGLDYTAPGWWQDRVNNAGHTPVEQEAVDYLRTFTPEERREIYEYLRDDEDQADAIGVQAEIFKRLEQEYAGGDAAGTDQAGLAEGRADDRTAQPGPRRAGQAAAQGDHPTPQGVTRPLSTDALAEDFGRPRAAQPTMDLVEAMALPQERIFSTKGGEPGTWARRRWRALFQREQRSRGITRASVEFSGGLEALRNGTETALIRALDSPNESSAIHEIAHIARRWLLNRDVPADQRVGITDQDIAITETWAGVSDGKWTTAAEEKFARGFERYLRDGVSPTPRLSKVFKAFATWLRDIYQSVIGSEIDVQISDEMRTVYDRLVTRAERIASGEAAREMQAAPSRSAQMVHGSTSRLSTLQPGSMFSDDPVWAAGYTTKLDAIGDGESFVGSVHHFDVPAGPTLTARSVHAAEGLVIDRATDILGRQPASLKEAAEAVAKETGAVAVLAERDGKVTGGILLVSAPVTGHADPREALRRARERGKDIPDNLSKALARKSGPPSTVKAKPSPVPDDIRTLGADDDSTPEFGASLEVPEAVRASLATSEQAALDRLRKKQAGGGVLYQDARPKRLSRFALDKPIKGQGGNSLVGYEWRWTYGERERADGDVVAAKVSDWDNFATSEGTGRKIVHVFYVQHADGRVTEEGINSAQSLLGIQNTRLRTIAEKEAARQKVFRKNVVDEVNDREANAFDSIGEAARNWWSRNRVATEADFKQTYGLTKDGKHIRYMGFAESIEGNKGSVKPLWPAMLEEFKARGWTVEAIGSTPADTSVLYQADLPTKAVDTSSEEFKRWFGQSKVVDESGNPLRVYHGTTARFDAFDPNKTGNSIDSGFLGKGFYFSTDPSIASSYTNIGRPARENAPNVKPVYVSLQNPYQWGIKTTGVRGAVLNGSGIPKELREPVYRRAGFVFDGVSEPDFSFEPVLSEALRDELVARGYDGVIAEFPERNGKVEREIVAFSPTQIKSATSNRGTFDPTNPSILYQSDAAEALPDDLPFDDRNDLLIVGAAKMARGLTDFRKWSEAMRADLGEALGPNLRDLYTASRNRAVLLSKFNPDDYFNFKRSSLTGDTLEALRASVIDTVLATGRIPKERETWDEIKVDAEYYGPEIVQYLAPFQKQQAQFRVVRYAAKQRIDVLKAEIYADWQRIDRLRLKGELDPAAYAVEERKIAAKERDVRGLLDVWMRMRSDDGRNLAMHRIIAERTWDDYEFWTKRAKRAMGLPPGVDLPREVEKRINQIIQGGKVRLAERKARAPREAAQKPSGPPSSKPRARTFTPKTPAQSKMLAAVEKMKAAMAAKAEIDNGNVLYQADTVKVDADLVQYAREFIEAAREDGNTDPEAAWSAFADIFGESYDGLRDAFEEAARDVFDAPEVVIPKVARSKRRTKLDDLRGLGREDDGTVEFDDPNAGKPTRREVRQREDMAAGAFGDNAPLDGMIEDDGTVEYAEPVAPPTAEERTAQRAANRAARTAREDTASGAFGQDIEDEVKRDLAKMLMGLDKSGPVETVLALRKAGLLTGVKTALRNIGGNTAFQALEEVARIPSSLVDMALALYSGQRTVAGMSPVAFAKATREAATNGIAEAREIMKGERSVDAFLKTGERRELNSGYKWLDAYANTVFRFLSAQDAVFKSYAFRRSMEEQATLMAKERGVTPAELLLQPTEAMIVRAVADAEFATFNNPNMVAKAWNSGVSHLKANGPGGQALAAVAEFVVPFTNTPSNIIARLFDYMGVNAIGRVSVHAWQSVVKDGLTPEHQRVIAQALGRGLTGSALVYAGYLLAAAGKMTGGGEDEDRGDRNVATAAGRLPGAILVGDRWHTVSAFSPVGMLLTVGASLHRRHTKPEANKAGLAADAFRVGSQVMLDQPMLSGMQDTLNLFRRDGQERYLASQAGSFIPTIVSDVASLFDPYRRETRTDGFLPSLWAGVQSRLPGARNYLPQRVDALGRTQDQIASNAINPFLSTPAKELSDPVVKALLDADVGVTFPVRKQGEDEDAYRVRVEKTGQEIERFVKATVSAPGFAKLPVERRTKLLKAAIDRAKDRVPAPKATP